MKGRKGAKKRQRGEAPPPRTAVLAGPSKQTISVLCVALAVAVLAVYAQTAWHGFIAYDDDQYVYKNPIVKAGLTGSGVVWAFTTFFYANWHPLTWLSLMLDAQLFGENAGAYHMMNLTLHLTGTVLLFLALVRMTGQPWRSAMVAGIFALHPLHVESVAWISERKDVLSTALAMLAVLLYVRYTESPTRWRYAWMALALALGLLAKPMLVTFPFVLLLLDLWPLRRLTWPPSWPTVRPLLWEKAPLFAMVAIASALTFVAQRDFGAVASLSTLPFSDRLANAAVGYVAYIGKAVWPIGLGVLYPIEKPAAGSALAALLVLAAVTAVALSMVRKRPYIFVGWFWYVGTLVPVIGLVQVGSQSMADRYTYFPLVGFSLALVWLAADLAENRPLLRNVVAALSGVVLLLLAIGAYGQTEYWKSGRTLFEHTVAVTRGNYTILNNLGVSLADEGKHGEAIARYREAIALNPRYADAYGNLGEELMKSGHLDEAYPSLVEAERLKPGVGTVETDLGVLKAARGDFEEALGHLQESVRRSPENPEGQSDLCYVLQRVRRLDEAIAHCHEALRLKPDFPDARFNLATALASQGKKAEAAAEFSHLLQTNPGHAAARAELERLQGAR